MPRQKGNASGTPSSKDYPPTDGTSSPDISVFLNRLGKPISDIQKLLTEYPSYEGHFLEYYENRKRENDLVEDLEQKEQRIRELETGVAAFDSVHIKASEALKAEVKVLKERLGEANDLIAASKERFVKEFEKKITQHNQEMEKTLQSHSTSLAKQKSHLEKQHLEAIEKQRSQLDVANCEIQKKSSEVEELDWKNNGLKKKLNQSNGKLRALQQELTSVSDEVFEGKWKELAEVFHLFCKTRFTSLPQGSTVEEIKLRQQEIKEELRLSGFTDKIPFPIPTSNIEASKLLRLAGVESLISQSLCNNVFRPVINYSDTSGIFESISERLHRDNPWKEAVWRSLTINALVEDDNNIDAKVQDMATEILNLTSPLIQQKDQENVKKELIELFKLAFGAWRPAQRNSTRIFATTDFTNNASPDWGSQQVQDDFCGVSADDLIAIDPHSKVLCLFPRVYRERISTPDSDVSSGDMGYIYFAGTALYADSGAYVVGQREHREYKKFMEELEKKVHAAPVDLNSRRSRRVSISKGSQPQPPPGSLKSRLNSPQSATGKEVESSVVSGSSQRPPSAIPRTPK